MHGSRWESSVRRSSQAASSRGVLGRCVRLGSGALLACALFTVAMSPGDEPALDLATLRVDGATNGHAVEVPAAADGSWAVQILADIQDGFRYLPQILSEGAEHGARAVVIAGDLQRGDGGRHIDLVLRELRQRGARVPLFAVPGNHDAMTASDRQAFQAAFGGDVFEFRIGSTWFEGLDSTNPGGFEAERTRLQSRIAQASRAGESVVVVRHHSPLRDVGGIADDALLEVLRDPSVAFVIAGHAHTSRVDRIGTTRFVVAPPSGDRSHGQGQTLVSYLILRSDGTRLTLELHQLSRRNRIDAQCAWTHAWLVHVLPFLRGGPSGSRPSSPVLADRG